MQTIVTIVTIVTTIRVVMSVGDLLQLLLATSFLPSSFLDRSCGRDPEPRLRDMQLYKPGKLMKRNSFPSPYAAAYAIQSAHLSITCMRHLLYVHSGIRTISSEPGADARFGPRNVVSKMKFPQRILVHFQHPTVSTSNTDPIHSSVDRRI